MQACSSKEAITNIAAAARESLLPAKSKNLYEETYSTYRKWCSSKEIKTTCEDSILAYFSSELCRYKSSSLWSKYSMLRSTINLREKIDISKFPSVIPYLKRKGEGFKPKKSLILNKNHIDEFLIKADNKEHLFNKAKVVVPYPHTNLELELPITVGNIPLQGVNTSIPGPPLPNNVSTNLSHINTIFSSDEDGDGVFVVSGGSLVFPFGATAPPIDLVPSYQLSAGEIASHSSSAPGESVGVSPYPGGISSYQPSISMPPSYLSGDAGFINEKDTSASAPPPPYEESQLPKWK